MRTFRKSIPSKCLNCGRIFYPFFAAAGKFCGIKCRDDFKCSPEKLAERFWSQVDKNGPTPEHCPELGPCWIWTGLINDAGYGIISIRKRPTRAHRLAWKLAGHHDPGRLFICHRCDNRKCVRDSHLFRGTPLDNMLDCKTKGRNPNPAKKITEKEVLDIRAKFANGMSNREINAFYPLTRSSIENITARRTWKDI